VLAAGGSTDVWLSLTMARHAVCTYGAVEVLDPADLDGDGLVMPCGLVGSPTIAGERVWSGAEGGILRDEVERLMGATVHALMSFEVAGANGLLAVAWAARLRLPIVDADGMGRAFPALQQQAMMLAGVSACPAVVTDGRGTTIVIETQDDGRLDRLARSCAGELGGCCAVALCCLPSRRVADTAITGSLSRAIGLGRALAAAATDERAEALSDALGGTILVRGVVVELERRSRDGRAEASATVAGTDGDRGRRVRLELQSEYLLALEDGAARAAVPDLICVLATDTGTPIPTELLRLGARVAVVVAPADATWRSPAAQPLVGPAAFGYDIDLRDARA
jgi:DUF917 family protein